MINTLQLIEWFDGQIKRIDRLLEEKSYYLYHDMPELYENQLRQQRYYYSTTIAELTRLVNNDKHFSKIEAWEAIKSYLVVKKGYVNLYEAEYRTIELKNGCIDELESEEDYENVQKIVKALEMNYE